MTNLRLIATAAVGLAVGSVIGYKYAEKKMLAEFEERLERETNLVRRMYKPEHETPQDMVEELYGEAIKEYQGEEGAAPESKEPVAYHKIRPSSVEIAKKEEKLIERSVFQPSEDRGEIHVITANEQQESGYEQVTWTYYAKDGVVTDVHEDRIEDYAKFLGTDFIEMFGVGSDDENVVYIRNEVLMIDYEVVRSHGAYVEEVLNEEYKPIERPSQRIRGG